MNYLGACALLARLSGRVRDEDDLECIKRALDDCAKATNGRFEVIRAGNGWSLGRAAWRRSDYASCRKTR